MSPRTARTVAAVQPIVRILAPAPFNGPACFSSPSSTATADCSTSPNSAAKKADAERLSHECCGVASKIELLEASCRCARAAPAC